MIQPDVGSPTTVPSSNVRYTNMQPQLTRVGVPEPGTTLLLASGMLGLFAVGYRRKSFEA